MPIPNDYKVPVPQLKFETYPPDIYQVKILDIELDKEYISSFTGQKQDRFKFTYLILEGKYRGKKYTSYASAKWFSGKGKETKLYTIVRCVYAYYFPDINLSNIRAEEMLGSKINELIGKQIRINLDQVKKGDRTYNTITSFLPIKKEIKEEATKEEEEFVDPDEINL